MKIQLLFDSYTVNDQFKTGWGLSIFINEQILFDTGCDGNDLLHNLKTANINVSKIKKVVISHDHYDHTGGLRAILKNSKNTIAYLPLNSRHTLKSEIQHLGNNFLECNCLVNIEENIFTTCSIFFSYKGDNLSEQSLVVDSPKGLIIITGCAHPGIISILNKVKEQFSKKRIYAVIGGFHLHRASQDKCEKIVSQFKKIGVIFVAPIHCSGQITAALFKKIYGNNCIDLKVGQIIEL